VFGFNNPNPSPGSPNYGYDLWITIGPEEEAEDDMRILDFPGGLYAVTRLVEQGDFGKAIPAAWAGLHTWCEHSRYRIGRHQWLEEHSRTADAPPGQWTLDLYMPIVA
jgi:predicted transcriptional regulator YdeE